MEWVLLIGAALLIGVAKTSFGGLASLSVAMLALAMPTKESTAAALLLLITGDVVAVLRYRKAADWKLLRGLIPAVVPGLLLGAWFLSWVDDLVLKRSIGALLLLFVIRVEPATRTGSGRNVPDLSWARRSSRNPGTPTCSAIQALDKVR